ncbi:hypothetical protein OHB37_18415 [Streptomyces albidoflavus]|uniref:hypothetical protein n=1 Tax=Streptomyces TaxID=1883 RepID=UPI001BE66566|nr:MULTISPECIES: hypothetical protein [unclassified Streptomyces]WSB16023.1 hypothetical protein OHB37_18415 [Streptomyces albidoflavus]MBT2879709.1 hypothetical protein [Streptomyces sp. McG6]MBT2884507.1 hypothetical protein [Streptomyces sp. McG5]MBT2893480.1 hypothetical protein [Streptomyces sp. McG2]WSD41589.1 hypothetical protein OG919_18410 [Streptomyces albidoflavus]
MARVPAPHRIGEPQADGEFLPGTLDGHLAGPLSRFLEEAEPVLFSPGTTPDPFSDAPGMRVRIGVMTDGTRVWQLAWSDHVAFHRVAPPRAFLEHVTSLGFTAPEISVDRALDIAEAEGLL